MKSCDICREEVGKTEYFNSRFYYKKPLLYYKANLILCSRCQLIRDHEAASGKLKKCDTSRYGYCKCSSQEKPLVDDVCECGDWHCKNCDRRIDYKV